MSFLDNHGLSSLWNKIQDKLATKADSSHDHTSISGTAENVTGVVDIAHGGTSSPTRNGALRALINGGSGFTGDINTLTDTGVYWINLSDCTNGPTSSGYGTMEVISYEVILQRFTSYQDGNVYCRTYTNSQWYEWQEIFGTSSVVPISSGGTGSTNRGEAYKTLITGGVVSSEDQHDLNDYKTPGVYWINLSNHSNGPGTKGFGHLEVISGSNSLFIQRFTYFTGNIYYRTFANSQWYDWKQIPTAVVGIENGGTGRTSRTAGLTALLAGSNITGDLNFIDSGVYAFSTNDCTNCPPYSSWYLLLVFRYAEGDKVCVQIATTLGNPRHTYIRTSSVSGTFTSWVQLTNFTDSDGVKLELNADMRNLETGIYFNRGRSAGNKYSFLYEADDDYPELSIRQHTPTYDKVFRISSNANYTWIQSDGSLYIGNSSHPVTRIYTKDYGSTLPSAGSKGRIFFKKV